MSTKPLAQALRRPETLLLATIHTWSVAGAPRINRLLPALARVGDPLVVCGSGFHGGSLRAHFGRVSTWALALSDHEALLAPSSGEKRG